MNPETINKYLYIEKTPTWLVRSFYVVGLSAWFLVVYGYMDAMVSEPVYRLIAIPTIIFFTLYTTASFGLNLFYKQFDLQKHHLLLKSFWYKKKEPIKTRRNLKRSIR
jgi:hypothetical protein